MYVPPSVCVCVCVVCVCWGSAFLCFTLAPLLGLYVCLYSNQWCKVITFVIAIRPVTVPTGACLKGILAVCSVVCTHTACFFEVHTLNDLSPPFH